MFFYDSIPDNSSDHFYNHPAGLLPRARILVLQEGDYELQILLNIEKGTVYS